MTDKSGVGVTVIGHDSESRKHVNGYGGDGSYSRDVYYTGASISVLIHGYSALDHLPGGCHVILLR